MLSGYALDIVCRDHLFTMPSYLSLNIIERTESLYPHRATFAMIYCESQHNVFYISNTYDKIK